MGERLGNFPQVLPAPRRTTLGEKANRLARGLYGLGADTGAEIFITKHNKPVAKLVPVGNGELRPFVGRSSGVIRAAREDLLAPLDEGWEVDADL